MSAGTPTSMVPPVAAPPVTPSEVLPWRLQDDPPRPPTDLLEEDGVPLESDWHRLAMTLLIDSTVWHLRPRQDFYAGGNCFIYFSAEQARNRDYRGPDYFFVWGRPLNPPRPYWAIWDEDGKYPDVIIELSSPTTIRTDYTTKKTIYEQTFRTPDYFICDPYQQKIDGWHLVDHVYHKLEPNEHGRLWCDQLQLWLGFWKGVYQGREETYLRFFDKEGNVVPTGAEGEYARAEAEAQRAEAEAQRAEAEAQRAEQERKRAETAEAELAILKAQLAAGGKIEKP